MILTQRIPWNCVETESRQLERLLSHVIPAPLAVTLVRNWALDKYLIGHLIGVGLKAAQQKSKKPIRAQRFAALNAIWEEESQLLNQVEEIGIQKMIEAKSKLALGLAWDILDPEDEE